MPTFGTIATDKLARLIGLPTSPAIIDVRTDEDAAADPRLIPASVRRSHRDVEDWAAAYRGRPVVVTCQRGGKIAQGTAAFLRHHGVDAEVLDGGFEGWAAAGLPLVPVAALPPRDRHGRTVWVTRHRPKIDRIACPWLIRRFVDPAAVFLFVAPSEVEAVAERFAATPFDLDGVDWSHRGPDCTFDLMVERFGLATPVLARIALIVRGADTARLDLAPECAGLLAISLGLSRQHGDDLQQLEAGLAVYDALYRWARDASDEVHDWKSRRPEPAR
jgi:rhodanese-related sulfurtransferase